MMQQRQHNPAPYDPYLRPPNDLSVEEWRILIASVAGRLRISQGFTRRVTLAPGQIVQAAANNKSYALFLSIQVVGAPATFLISSSDSMPDTLSLPFLNIAEQVMLPSERLYIQQRGVAPIDVTITEVTV